VFFPFFLFISFSVFIPRCRELAEEARSSANGFFFILSPGTLEVILLLSIGRDLSLL